MQYLIQGKLPRRSVEPHGDEQQNGKRNKRRTAIAHERQRNAHHRHQADGHAHVHQHVEQQDRGHAVAVNPAERLLLPFAHAHQAQDQHAEQGQHDHRPQKAPLFAYRTEDEVGMPFGHEAVLDLRAFEESLAPEPARTDGDFRLIDVVVRAEGIADDAQKTQDV